MKKTVSRFIAIFIVVLILTSTMNISAFAAEARESSYFSGYNAIITPIGNGRVEITFYVRAKSIVNRLGVAEIQICKSNGTTVKTINYTDSGYGYMMGSNTYKLTATASYTGVSGQRYYAVVTFFAMDSSGSDLRIYATNTVTA